MHVDGASGGMIAPFLDPDLVWDFRLPRVASINTSGQLKISTGVNADLSITGTGNALSVFGLAGNTGTASALTVFFERRSFFSAAASAAGASSPSPE